MQKTIKKLAVISIAATAVIFSQCTGGGGKTTGSIYGPYATNQLPSDEDTSGLNFNLTQFNQWFKSGSVTKNGAVNFANSAQFESSSNMNFFKWSEQMFLWLTSPTPGSVVFNSPVFYTVSPAYDSAGNAYRTLTRNDGKTLLRAASHISQKFGNGAILIRNKKGQLLKLELPSKNTTKPVTVMNAKDEKVEVKEIRKNSNGTHTLLDASGNAIELHRQAPRNGIAAARLIKVHGVAMLFNTATGAEEELGQAGSSNALMAQNKSLIYYITMINDVYARFVNAIAQKGYADTALFPTSINTLQNIAGTPLPKDSNALAMELKTSWVEVDGAYTVKNANSNYVTIDAMVPVYRDTVINSLSCIYPHGERRAKLALVGMHVIGSVAGHPEMIWASFEHRSNAPDSSFVYLKADSAFKTSSVDTGNNWLLSNNPGSQPQNAQHMTVGSPHNPASSAPSDTIYADSGYAIAPSNTLRTCPFGNSLGLTILGNPHKDSLRAAGLNSKVIALNNFINANLAAGDLRKNYMFIGSEWTIDGIAPNGNIDGGPTNTTPGGAVGNSTLANATMETVFQSYSTIRNGSFTCFGCHSSPNGVPSLYPDSISHVYSDILRKLKNK